MYKYVWSNLSFSCEILDLKWYYLRKRNNFVDFDIDITIVNVSHPFIAKLTAVYAAIII